MMRETTQADDRFLAALAHDRPSPAAGRRR